MRDVDDVHDAEDQRQAARHQGVDAADEEAERQCLHQLGHAFPFLGSGWGPGGKAARWPVRARATGPPITPGSPTPRQPCQGVLATALSTVAAAVGATISGVPLCHWPSRNCEVGAPVSSHFSGPRMVCTVWLCSQSAILVWSVPLVASAAACSTWAVA